MKVNSFIFFWICLFFLLILGVYVAIVPIIMEQNNEEMISLNTVNFTAIALKFLAAMQPNKTCLHHKALEL